MLDSPLEAVRVVRQLKRFGRSALAEDSSSALLSFHDDGSSL